MQHSIFEPLYCLQAPTMKALTPQASSLFTISPLSPASSPFPAINCETPLPSCDQDIPCSFLAPIFTPSPISSHYRKVRSDHHQELTCDSTHVHLPLSQYSTLSATSSSPSSINSNSTHPKLASSHSITSFTTSAAPSSVRSNHDADDDRLPCDDGSVASKLLSSITKSISSPSLQLKSCKEAARETPYQKTLKLKQMKLQHCAEALGMESSDNSSFLCDSQCAHQEKIGIVAGNSSTFSSSSYSHQDSSLKLVKSSPNLTSCASHLTTNHSRYTRSASFPPPLSHTLPTSSSYDSVSISLRAYREDGRLILKETMVPSKHYFQANRRNGRLTLHVFTREEEEEEHFARQDDHEEFSYRELQRESLSEAEEKVISMCSMLSLYEKTPRESFDNKVEYCNNMTNQSLSEGVCVKKSLGMHSSKEINVAASHLDVSLQRLKYIANHNNTHIDTEDDGKRNVISNVITVSLQTSSHSKLTLHKAQVLNLPHLSSFPIVSSSLKHSAFIHSTGRNHGFLSSNHDMRTSPQSKENFVWESNLMPRAAATSGSRQKERKGGGGSGCGGAAAVLPAFVVEEKSLIMEPHVSELATSLFLEARYASGDWCLGAGKKKGLLSAGENGESGTTMGGHVSTMESAIIDAQIIDDEGQIRNDANFGYNTEEEKARNTSEGVKDLKMASPLNLDLQFSSSNASEEWLHTLHCKELFDRQHFGQPLMKLHCIPTKS